MNDIQESVNKFAALWMKEPWISAIGQGLSDGKPCIRVYCESMSDALSKLPDSFDGWPLSLIEAGGQFTANEKA